MARTLLLIHFVSGDCQRLFHLFEGAINEKSWKEAFVMDKGGNIRVLVIDDEETMLEVCSEVLESAGYSVRRSYGGQEALGLLIDEDWDVVLTDVHMPGLGGVDLFKETIARKKEMRGRFLFMTGDKRAIETVSSMDSNFIKKPFRVKDLLSAVESIIPNERSTPRKEARVKVAGCGVVVEAGGEQVVSAVTEDFSRQGMRIRYSGSPIEPGSVLGLRLSALCLSLVKQAKVVWSREDGSQGASSGLLFTMPLPDSVIADLAVQGLYF